MNFGDFFFFTLISFLVNKNSSAHSIPAFGDGSWSASENNVFVINLCLFEQVLFFSILEKRGHQHYFSGFLKKHSQVDQSEWILIITLQS